MAFFSFRCLTPRASCALARSRRPQRRRTSACPLHAEVLEERRLLSASVVTGLDGASPGDANVIEAVDATPAAVRGSAGHSASGWIADPVGDFLPTYTGPHDPGLDVIAHRVMVTPNRVIFSGRMAGPIAPTQEIGGIYIIGVDRGQGTPRFLNGTPQIGPHVLWDLIVRINPNGTGLVNNQIAGVTTPLDPNDIVIDGDTFTASVPLDLLLPASTRPPEEWTYNLWPRNGLIPGQNQHVSDLAPDDGNSPVRTLPATPRAATASLRNVVLEGEASQIAVDSLLPAGFHGLNVAIERFIPIPPPIAPPNPIRVSPVFLLNFGDTVDGGTIPPGLTAAVERFKPGPPPIRVSPIFFGLTDGDGGPVVDAADDNGVSMSLDDLWGDPLLMDELLA